MCFQKLRGEFRKRGGGLVNMITEGGERSHIFKYDSKLQTGIVVCVYQCKVTMIRNRYPSKSGKYIGEKLSVRKTKHILIKICARIIDFMQ